MREWHTSQTQRGAELRLGFLSGMKQLKAELQTKLDLPGWISCRRDDPEGRSSQRSTGIGRINVVEGIKELRAKLNGHTYPREWKANAGRPAKCCIFLITPVSQEFGPPGEFSGWRASSTRPYAASLLAMPYWGWSYLM